MKSASITFRTTPELKEAIQKAAGKSISDYINNVLQNHLNVRQMTTVSENVRQPDVRQTKLPVEQMVRTRESKAKPTVITHFGSKRA